MESKSINYYWLDTIRFISAFVVVISHTSIVFGTNYEGLAQEYQTTMGAMQYVLLRSGAEAVMVFFVLSGFLVGGRTVDKLIEGTFDSKKYVIDRAVRILLPLISALILSYITNTLLDINYSWYDYIGNLFSLQDILVEPVNDVLWSLSREVWYFIFMFGISALCVNKYTWVGGIVVFFSMLVFLKLGIVGLFAWSLGFFFF